MLLFILNQSLKSITILAIVSGDAIYLFKMENEWKIRENS